MLPNSINIASLLGKSYKYSRNFPMRLPLIDIMVVLRCTSTSQTCPMFSHKGAKYSAMTRLWYTVLALWFPIMIQQFATQWWVLVLSLAVVSRLALRGDVVHVRSNILCCAVYTSKLVLINKQQMLECDLHDLLTLAVTLTHYYCTI